MSENPFRYGLADSLAIEPCVLVILGVTGDLSHRKLLPALYNLNVDGLLPSVFQLVGFARRDWSTDEFRAMLKQSVEQYSRRQPPAAEILNEFLSHSSFVSGTFEDRDAYQRLKRELDQIDSQLGKPANRIFYFATAPESFQVITDGLSAAGLLEESSGGGRRRARAIVEKPFGHDLASARDLSRTLLQHLQEYQIYRIDHYLGKETVQNLLVFRFANGIFEPIWNRRYISHVEISVCESIGVGSRAGYFDGAGILRDIVQNHALQLLTLIALEPPVVFDADAVRDEKVKVLRAAHRMSIEEAAAWSVRGQYAPGFVGGEPAVGYRQEKGVPGDSNTETYFAFKVLIDNWRWSGVPFFIRAGKRVAKRVTDISIHFRNVPYRLFNEKDVPKIQPNVLSFQIQPDEGIALKMSAKPPGPRIRVQNVKMEFSYGSSFGIEPPEAYERLLLDCMRGDATLFTRADEIEQSWDLIAPIQQFWHERPDAPLYSYISGSWGPAQSDDLIRNAAGEDWRRL